MNKVVSWLKTHTNFLILILFIILSSWWLIFKGLPWQHDIEFHYSRLYSLVRTIQDGDVLAYIHNAFYGYGYGLGLFYSNFFFYLPAIFCLLGVSYLTSYKIFLLIINIFTILITYFCSKKILKDVKASLFVTMVYVFSPYRMLDIFVRGAMGEVLAFMVLPLIILGFYEILFGDKNKWYYFTIGFVLLVLSHLISSLLVAIFLVLFLIIYFVRFQVDRKKIFVFVKSGLVGLLFGAFFFFPLIEQYLFANLNIFESGSVYLPWDATIPFWKLVASTDFIAPTLGLPLFLSLFLRVFIKKEKIKDEKNILFFADIFAVLGIVALFCVTKIFPWKALGGVLSFIQFPWRLLLLVTLFFSFASGIYLLLLRKYPPRNKKLLKVFTLFAIAFSFITISLYSIQYGIRKNHYEEFSINEIGTEEYLPYGTDTSEITKEGDFSTNLEELEISYEKQGTSVLIWYKNNMGENTYIDVPLFYYLGYKIEGGTLTIGDNNQIRVMLPQEEGEISLYYEGTPVQKISLLVSIFSVFGFCVFQVLKNRKEKC